MFKTILAATDGSETARRAVDTAIDLAAKYGAELHLVHVRMHGRPVEELERMAEIEHLVPELTMPMPQSSSVPDAARLREIMAETEHEARAIAELGELILRRATDRAKEAGVTTVKSHATGGDYADGILDAVDDLDPDLLVMGRRGLGRLRQLLIGSVSNKVVQNCDAAVLLIK